MATPEPILDIVRALSTVASAGIIYGQLKDAWNQVYTGSCNYCRGAGKITCRHCRGTKSMRKRPAQLLRTERALVDTSEDDYYPCVYCGPATKYDFDSQAQDDDNEANMINENLKAALAARLRPNPFRCYAGTVPCPECHGSPLVRRHTPNFERFFNFELPWHFQVQQRAGFLRLPQEAAPAAAAAAAAAGGGGRGSAGGGIDMAYPGTNRSGRAQSFRFLEYPPKPPPLDKGAVLDTSPKMQKAGQDGSFAMSAKDQFKLDDYVLTYVEDEE